ncbi:hypothetical protein [Rhodococcus artemisiae]|uniref:Uncharacterized protein n=1 Tax=Rhodococcus artemisiae TaxID=714159 RepID=A0ABU7LIW8_9NOCA|nr:hypothetical protein [Rhodococcus artemisiae]MEE2061500.1 hypothetical protein [Rhodococcus artemisiae]
MKNWLGLFAALVVLGLIIEHWQTILVVLGIIFGVVLAVAMIAAAAPKLRGATERALETRRNAAEMERARRSGLRARALTQHDWYLGGSDRGVYGEFPPIDLAKL